MNACYSTLVESMNSFLAETEIEPKVRYSNLAEAEIWLKLEIDQFRRRSQSRNRISVDL